MTVFLIQQQIWVATTETIWLLVSKICTFSSFPEQVCQPLFHTCVSLVGQLIGTMWSIHYRCSCPDPTPDVLNQKLPRRVLGTCVLTGAPYNQASLGTSFDFMHHKQACRNDRQARAFFNPCILGAREQSKTLQGRLTLALLFDAVFYSS